MPEQLALAGTEAPALPAAPAPAPDGGRTPDSATPAPAASGAEAAQNTGAQATPAKPEAKPDTQDAAARRQSSRFERRIDKAYRERAEALARAEQFEKRLAELEKPKSPDGEPTLAQFDYDPEKYAAAKAEFAKTQVAKESEAKARMEGAKQEHQRLVSRWEKTVSKADTKYDDFDEIVGDLQPNTPFVAAIMEAENGDDIAYHLGKNPDEAERIAKLPPLSQVREIGKLEAKFLATPPVQPKAPSKAPAPITPLAGTAPVVSAEPLPSDDDRTWIEKRSKQVHRRR